YRMRQAHALESRGELFNDPTALHQAAALYAGQVLDLSSSGTERAATQEALGVTLTTIGAREDPPSLHLAVASFHAALTWWTRDQTPDQWALTQNDLGIALRLLGERGDVAALRDAVTAFNAALEIVTEASSAEDWARLQANLGNV